MIRISAALLFLSVTASAQFQDVSAKSGLDFKLVSGTQEKAYILESMTGGVGFIDFDNDGWIDIYLVNGAVLSTLGKADAQASDRLYRNNHDGTFTDVTAKAGLGDTSWGMGVAVADVDNNGFDDLYITNYGPNRLYLNNGDGTFRDTAAAAGVAGKEWSSSAAFGDYDGDGDVDLYVANYLEFDPNDLPDDSQLCRYRGIRVQCGPRGMIPTADRLYENLGDGRFKDVTTPSGIGLAADSYGLGVVWADYDNDGDQDVYVANDSTANFLFQNNGDKTFTEVALLAGVALTGDGKEQAGMGVDFGDYDNDGDLDLFVTNFSDDYNTLYRNEGDGQFHDVSYESGFGKSTWLKLSWGTQFVDFNRDGLLDIVIANGHVYPEVDNRDLGISYRQSNSAFLNRGDGTFKEVELDKAGGKPQSSRGLATGDFNNDGAMDLLIANLDAAPSLLQGTVPRGTGPQAAATDDHWILLDLVGTKSNTAAIGARATIKAAGRAQMREVRSGGSYASQSDLRLHFGVGEAKVVDEVRIRWPNGAVQVIEGVKTGQVLRIEEPK